MTDLRICKEPEKIIRTVGRLLILCFGLLLSLLLAILEGSKNLGEEAGALGPLRLLLLLGGLLGLCARPIRFGWLCTTAQNNLQA